MTQYSNPYYGTSFFEFFWVLATRIGDFFLGNLSIHSLAADEIQLLVLIGVSLSSAIVGCFLVLRKMTMLANSLSHTILLGIVGAFVFSQVDQEHAHQTFALSIPLMMLTSVIMGIITTFLTEFLSKTIKLQEDASTGIVFTSLFALGIILVTILTKNAHIGAEAVMGNVDALQFADAKLIFYILLFNLFSLFLFYKEFKITTFDSAYANALGISATLFNYLLMVQVSLTVIGAFRSVGVLMVLAFITGSPIMARLLTHNLKKMILISALIGGLVSLIGVALARHFLSEFGIALSTGGLVVCVIALSFLVLVCYKTFSRLKKRTTGLV